jgi:hypothetical protein
MRLLRSSLNTETYIPEVIDPPQEVMVSSLLKACILCPR